MSVVSSREVRAETVGTVLLTNISTALQITHLLLRSSLRTQIALRCETKATILVDFCGQVYKNWYDGKKNRFKTI